MFHHRLRTRYKQKMLIYYNYTKVYVITNLIILQLKSTQNTNALTDISSIIDYIYDKYEYRIKSHEIQQLHSNIRKMTLTEHANIISSFCTHHEIEYLTYHAPIFRHNIFDQRWHSRITDSIRITVKEIERVFCNASLKNKVIVVFHLTNFISKDLLPTISKEIKYKIMKKHKKLSLLFIMTLIQTYLNKILHINC
jgi:hypothetical protein